MSPDIANHRLGTFKSSLANQLELPEGRLTNLVKCINPFNDIPPKPQRVEMTPELTLGDIFNDDEVAHELLDIVNNEMFHDIPKNLNEAQTPDEMFNALRTAAHIDPFYSAIATREILLWPLVEGSYEFLAEGSLGDNEPAFFISSDDGNSEYPVYCAPFVTTPGDNSDSMLENLKAEVQRHNSRALILFSISTYKEIEGRTYTSIGTFFDGTAWHWTLLNHKTPESQVALMGKDNFDLESPAPHAALKDDVSYNGVRGRDAYNALVNGYFNGTMLEIPEMINLHDDPKKWSMVLLPPADFVD